MAADLGECVFRLCCFVTGWDVSQQWDQWCDWQISVSTFALCTAAPAQTKIADALANKTYHLVLVVTLVWLKCDHYTYTEKQTHCCSLRTMLLLVHCNSRHLLTFPCPSAAPPTGCIILMTIIQPITSIWSSDVTFRGCDDSGEVWLDHVKT